MTYRELSILVVIWLSILGIAFFIGIKLRETTRELATTGRPIPLKEVQVFCTALIGAYLLGSVLYEITAVPLAFWLTEGGGHPPMWFFACFLPVYFWPFLKITLTGKGSWVELCLLPTWIVALVVAWLYIRPRSSQTQSLNESREAARLGSHLRY